MPTVNSGVCGDRLEVYTVTKISVMVFWVVTCHWWKANVSEDHTTSTLRMK